MDMSRLGWLCSAVAAVTALAPLHVHAQMTASDGGQTLSITQNTGSGDMGITVNGTPLVDIKQSGKLNLLEGGIQMGGDMATCDAGTKGFMQYSCGRPTYCNGTTWVTWPPGAEDRPKKMLAFVTPAPIWGGLGSSGSADAQCSFAAMGANLPGSFRAWISETSSNIDGRLGISSCASYNYSLVDGTKIADNYADLKDGSLDAAWNKMPDGTTYTGNVWTGTNDNGTSSGTHCGDWRLTTGNGTYGTSSLTGAGWSNAGSQICSSFARLYCVEEPSLSKNNRYPRVFYSSKLYNGTLQEVNGSNVVLNSTYQNKSIGGAHAICQSLSNTLSLGGSWSAWIASPGTPGSAPLYYLKKSTSLPYTDIFGNKIADNWADLVDGTLDRGIGFQEWGAIGSGALRAWTNVDTTGARKSTNQSTNACGVHSTGWNTNGAGSSGHWGQPGRVSSHWTDSTSTQTCDTGARLICVEQYIAPYTDYKNVFVTSGSYSGNLGGVTGADNTCQSVAQGAGLSGTYKAWVADSSAASAPATRFTQSTVPYRLLDGRVIAENWTDLTNGNDTTGDSILTPINVTETGSLVSYGSSAVWTNVANDGTQKSAVDHCTDWTSNGAGVNGNSGVSVIMTGWTDRQTYTCNSTNKLYCFEQ